LRRIGGAAYHSHIEDKLEALMTRIVSSFVAVYLSTAIGCSDGTASPPAQAEVGGTVTLDGKPMSGGEVRFEVAGQPTVSLPVTDGAFSGKVFTGQNRVGVVWEKEGAPHPMDPSQKLMKNVIDSKFSGPTSPFKQEITASGAKDLSFQVTSAR
jgi:hypothetical protein